MSKQTKGDDYAFPGTPDCDNDLTKRELFAALAMQGLCANPTVVEE